jgi:protein-S-isoprenylcysteine O-methyltransferase Ste14
MLKALSIVGYLGMVLGVIAQLATGNLFSSSPVVIAVQVGAALLFLWARLTFGWRSYHVVANPTEGGLVTSGPHRYVRHPIYTAMGVLSAAGVVAHWSWEGGLLGGLVVGSALLRVFCEEILVTAHYPEYRQYTATT